MRSIKYLVAGAGGIGGAIAGKLAEAGKEVTLIARGAHLDAIRERGLVLAVDQCGAAPNHDDKVSGNGVGSREERTVKGLRACTADEYIAQIEVNGEAPDVIFICVKGYSIPGIAPFLSNVAKAAEAAKAANCPIMIPILNGFCMGEHIRGFVTGGRIVEGLTFLSSQKDGPGRILMRGEKFRMEFGDSGRCDQPPVTDEEGETIAEDLRECGIDAYYTNNILPESIRKFTFVASAAGAGYYYDALLREFQKPGEKRDTLASISGEIRDLASAMGVTFDYDLVEKTLEMADTLSPDSNSSLQRDMAAGGRNEFDSLIREPVRMGEKYGVDMPVLRKVAESYSGDGLSI